MRKSQKIINLFNEKNISSIKTVFSISNEEDLDQCWHYFQQHHDASTQSLDHFISLFYKFAYDYLAQSQEHFFELILESSEEHYYLTVWNKLVSKKLSDFLEDQELEYIFDHKKLSLRLEKDISMVPETRVDLLPACKVQLQKDSPYIPSFEFISTDDLNELLASCEDMEDIILLSKQHGCVERLFIRLRSCLTLFVLTLSSYNELEKVTRTVKSFSALINHNEEAFLSLSIDKILLIEGFIFNIEKWLKALFIEGGVSLDFMDDSLQSDFEMISLLILSDDSLATDEEENLEAIFDF